MLYQAVYQVTLSEKHGPREDWSQAFSEHQQLHAIHHAQFGLSHSSIMDWIKLYMFLIWYIVHVYVKDSIFDPGLRFVAPQWGPLPHWVTHSIPSCPICRSMVLFLSLLALAILAWVALFDIYVFWFIFSHQILFLLSCFLYLDPYNQKW